LSSINSILALCVEREKGNTTMKKLNKKLFSHILRSCDIRLEQQKREIDALYKLLYNQVRDLDNALSFSAAQTVGAFSFQYCTTVVALILHSGK